LTGNPTSDRQVWNRLAVVTSRPAEDLEDYWRYDLRHRIGPDGQIRPPYSKTGLNAKCTNSNNASNARIYLTRADTLLEDEGKSARNFIEKTVTLSRVYYPSETNVEHCASTRGVMVQLSPITNASHSSVPPLASLMELLQDFKSNPQRAAKYKSKHGKDISLNSIERLQKMHELSKEVDASYTICQLDSSKPLHKGGLRGIYFRNKRRFLIYKNNSSDRERYKKDVNTILRQTGKVFMLTYLRDQTHKNTPLSSLAKAFKKLNNPQNRLCNREQRRAGQGLSNVNQNEKSQDELRLEIDHIVSCTTSTTFLNQALKQMRKGNLPFQHDEIEYLLIRAGEIANEEKEQETTLSFENQVRSPFQKAIVLGKTFTQAKPYFQNKSSFFGDAGWCITKTLHECRNISDIQRATMIKAFILRQRKYIGTSSTFINQVNEIIIKLLNEVIARMAR